ncbi:MAG: HEPN domain-containing protein [Bacillota bacterium]
MSQDLLKWRITKAEETFKEGEDLLLLGHYSGAINRFYYAAFHAMRAVLSIKELDSAKHSGVIALFNQNFVKTGDISKEASKTISAMFKLRNDSDYLDFKVFTLQQAKNARDMVRSLINEIKCYLGKEKGDI